MRNLLPSICACAALVLGAPVAVLAQEGPAGPPDQYETVPAFDGRDRSAAAMEDPDGPPQYAADAPGGGGYQYASPAECGDSPCEVDEDVEDVVEDAAEDASGSAEDLGRALDATTASYADGEEDRAASAAETAEGPADGAPVAPGGAVAPGHEDTPPEDDAAPPDPSADRSGADAPEGAGRGSGGVGADGAVVPGELPATGGPPLVPVALGAGVLLLLLLGGPSSRRRRIVR